MEEEEEKEVLEEEEGGCGFLGPRAPQHDPH